MSRLGTRKRLERLEAVQARKTAVPDRDALVVIYDGDDGGDAARHLVMTGSDRGQYWFQERPDPGPQIEDFGEFAPVVYLTSDEMKM